VLTCRLSVGVDVLLYTSKMSDMHGVHSTEAWTQPASWKKMRDRRGKENQSYFHKYKGEERLMGKRVKLFKHIFTLGLYSLPLTFYKHFLLAI